MAAIKASGEKGGTGSSDDLFVSRAANDTASSAGAPSPEVNTLLEFAIVGGTVAFLKRKRRGGGTETATV